MKIGIIGLGLMGGSFALDIKVPFPNSVIYGIDNSAENLRKAKQIGLIDFVISYDDLYKMDVVLVAVPVNHSLILIPKVLDLISSNTLVFDVGSTKQGICELLDNHSKRGNYLAAHPMAGTEFSGPEAAQEGLYVGKINIVYDQNLIGEYDLLAVKDVKRVNVFTRLMKSINYLIWGDV